MGKLCVWALKFVRGSAEVNSDALASASDSTCFVLFFPAGVGLVGFEWEAKENDQFGGVPFLTHI